MSYIYEGTIDEMETKTEALYESDTITEINKADSEKSISNKEDKFDKFLKWIQNTYQIEKEIDKGSSKKRKFLIKNNEGELYFLKVVEKINKKVLDEIYLIIKEYPNKFLTPIETGEKKGFYYEIYKYYQQGTVKENLSFVKKNVEEVIFQLNESLKILHKNNIVHTDLKPSNIIVDGDKFLITDFEIAAIIKEDLEYGKRKKGIGSPYYTDLYLFELGYVKKTADYWSLGMLIYYIIKEGEFPFYDEEVFKKSVKKNGGIVVDDVELKYTKLLIGLLTYDPDKRIGYEEVKKWLEGDNFETVFDNKIGINFDGKIINSLENLVKYYIKDYEKAREHFKKRLLNNLKELNRKKEFDEIERLLKKDNLSIDDKLSLFMTNYYNNRKSNITPIYYGIKLNFKNIKILIENYIYNKVDEKGILMILENKCRMSKSKRKIYLQCVLKLIENIINLYKENKISPEFRFLIAIYNYYYSNKNKFKNIMDVHKLLLKIEQIGIIDYLNKNNDYLEENTIFKLFSFLLKLENIKVFIIKDNFEIKSEGIYFIENSNKKIFLNVADNNLNLFFLGNEKKKPIVSINNSEFNNTKISFLNLNLEIDSYLTFSNNSEIMINNCTIKSKKFPFYLVNSKGNFSNSIFDVNFRAIYAKNSDLFINNVTINSSNDGIIIDKKCKVSKDKITYNVKKHKIFEII
ncbi:protein kinase domain-containing protein [Marinitoga sp. 1155]|uniref:protein kinase domain-containing protein n=1 Tax=Marinitoga sp. 1155 TaxID=1428448 RepID=UPI000640DBB7|nr:protein kinase [Marinitoga sp. 1155]KLO23525.1 hypothetical protein X274_06470 [Marinitoga sp. 1155]